MIWVTRALCPARHCAYAMAWDDTTWTKAEAEIGATKQAIAHGMPSTCRECGGELVLESLPTPYRTKAEFNAGFGVQPEPPLPPDTPEIRFPGEATVSEAEDDSYLVAGALRASLEKVRLFMKVTSIEWEGDNPRRTIITFASGARVRIVVEAVE